MTESVDQPAAGLRERKRARTRAEIQGHALRLFHEQGYETTTMQQIIEEAEVSKSTLFGYFPTRAEVVLFDGMDALIVEAFRKQPHEPGEINALRMACGRLSAREASDQRERMDLISHRTSLLPSAIGQRNSAGRNYPAVLRCGNDPDVGCAASSTARCATCLR